MGTLTLKLGKKPAREGAIKLKFGAFFSAADLPVPPVVFGRVSLIANWGMLANDKVANCVFVGGAHETMLWRAWAFQALPVFTDATVIEDYAAVTGYDPGDPATDQGSDMQEAAAYRQKIGLIDDAGTRHRIDSYVALEPGNVDQIALAAYTLGAVGLGFNMPASAMDQFDRLKPWSPVAQSSQEGGHYVPCIGRNSNGDFLVVTWGRLHAVSPSFIVRNMDEGVAYLSFEQMRGTVSPRGFDEAALRNAMRKL